MAYTKQTQKSGCGREVHAEQSLQAVNQSVMEERIQEYLNSEEYELDLYLASQEYRDAGKPVPPDEMLREQVIGWKREWLKAYATCEAEGHAWTESADVESGTSELACTRCGENHHLQWL